jgi:hypothetical protein
LEVAADPTVAAASRYGAQIAGVAVGTAIGICLFDNPAEDAKSKAQSEAVGMWMAPSRNDVEHCKQGCDAGYEANQDLYGYIKSPK